MAIDTCEGNLHCYECLIVKQRHMFHCRKCNSCIGFHHKHSEFLGKCIGGNNAIAYWWFLFSNTVLNSMVFYCLVSCTNMVNEEQPSGFILSLVSCLVNIYE